MTGIITSNSGDMGTDVITASSSAMQQKAPQIADPYEAIQETIRQQNQTANVNKVNNVIKNEKTYGSENKFMSDLYHSLNPKENQSSFPTLNSDQVKAIHQIINSNQSDTEKANALNQIFLGAKRAAPVNKK